MGWGLIAFGVFIIILGAMHLSLRLGDMPTSQRVPSLAFADGIQVGQSMAMSQLMPVADREKYRRKCAELIQRAGPLADGLHALDDYR